MSGFLVRNVRRWSFPIAALTLAGALGVTVIACSSDTVAKQADDDSINVQTGSFSVTLENRTGVPLTDIKVAIMASGVPYTHMISRMEVGEKSESSLADFSDRTGTTFNLRLAQPKSVIVTATDVVSKEYKVEVPWK
ncbi:MAG TPA: hypothetical protein VNZ26_07530 [Vicinamibacterales bacterium]|jgi:hypothetical protein|nr:hypothetical protein [Vicinamibacterales bacterium]